MDLLTFLITVIFVINNGHFGDCDSTVAGITTQSQGIQPNLNTGKLNDGNMQISQGNTDLPQNSGVTEVSSQNGGDILQAENDNFTNFNFQTKGTTAKVSGRSISNDVTKFNDVTSNGSGTILQSSTPGSGAKPETNKSGPPIFALPTTGVNPAVFNAPTQATNVQSATKVTMTQTSDDDDFEAPTAESVKTSFTNASNVTKAAVLPINHIGNDTDDVTDDSGVVGESTLQNQSTAFGNAFKAETTKSQAILNSATDSLFKASTQETNLESVITTQASAGSRPVTLFDSIDDIEVTTQSVGKSSFSNENNATKSAVFPFNKMQTVVDGTITKDYNSTDEIELTTKSVITDASVDSTDEFELTTKSVKNSSSNESNSTKSATLPFDNGEDDLTTATKVSGVTVSGTLQSTKSSAFGTGFELNTIKTVSQTISTSKNNSSFKASTQATNIQLNGVTTQVLADSNTTEELDSTADIKERSQTAKTESNVTKSQNDSDSCDKLCENEKKKKVCVMKCKLRRKINCIQDKGSSKRSSNGNYSECYMNGGITVTPKNVKATRKPMGTTVASNGTGTLGNDTDENAQSTNGTNETSNTPKINVATARMKFRATGSTTPGTKSSNQSNNSQVSTTGPSGSVGQGGTTQGILRKTM